MNIHGKKQLKKFLNFPDEINMKKIDNIIFENSHVKKMYINKNNPQIVYNEKNYANLNNVDKNNYREVLILQAPFKYANKKLNKKIMQPKVEQIKEELNIYGSVKNRSYIDNINLSSNSLYRCNIDIRGFFPATSVHKIYTYFTKNYDNDIASILAALCCYCKDGSLRLAQGFPTSSSVAYLVNQNMIREIKNLVEADGLHFSIYVDDILIFGNKKISQSLIDSVLHIIFINGYEVNEKVNFGIKNPVHGVIKYKGSRTILTKKKIPVKTVYDHIIHHIHNHGQLDLTSFLEEVIPLIDQFNGKIRNLLILDKHLVPAYQKRLYTKVTSNINLQYKKNLHRGTYKLNFSSSKQKQKETFEKFLELCNKL